MYSLNIKFWKWQIAGAFIGFFLLLPLGTITAVSFLIGFSVMLIANTLFLSRFFFKKILLPNNELLIFYTLELMKFMILILGSVWLFSLVHITFIAYLLGLITAQAALFFLPFFIHQTR